MPDREDPFQCPNCGSVTCEKVSVPRPNGTTYVTIFYKCSICTVVFTDPVAFTRGALDRPRRQAPRSTVISYAAWGRANQPKKDGK